MAGWCRSKAIRCAQGRFRSLVPNRGFLGQSGAYRCSPVPWTPAIPYRAVTRSCAAALGVPRCIGYYMRKRSCRHTVAYGSLSLSVCVATLPYSGSTHRHSQELQCFLSRSPTLSGSFQKKSKALLILDSSIYLGQHNTCFLIATILRKFAKQNGLSKWFYHLLDTSSSYSPEHSAAIWNTASSGKSGSKSSGSSSGSASQRSALE